MKSTKRGAAADSNRGSSSSGHLHTLHQRLKHALSLGITRLCDDKEKKWQCTNIEIQRHVIRSLAAFLDCISGDASHHRLLKDSLADIVGALVWILQCKSGAIVGMAANMVVKLIGTNSSMMQLYLADLINPLSSLLCSKNVEVSTSCATALNMILSNLSVKSEKEVWEIVKEAKTVIQIIRIMREFPGGTLSIEYFQEMASLLSMILWQWPPSRYSVWNDPIMMKVLEDSCTKSNVSTKVAVLKLYSALALCNIVAKKLLENGETILPMMVNSMGGSEPLSIRIEGFRLAQHLVADEHRCKIMTSLHSGPLVKAIIGGMRGWSLVSGKIANDQLSLLEEACRLARITRWPGEHHICFWEEGIDKVLLDLLLENFDKQASEHPLSREEQMSIAQEGLDANFLLALRPHIWEILGWLALHCAKDFRPSAHRNELYVDILITCACVSFVEAIRKGCQICENGDTYRIESSSRSVLMMMHSPSTYIASKVRLILSGVLEPKGNEYLKRLLHLLKYSSSTNNYGLPNIHKTVIELVGLICYSGLPQYQKNVIGGDGMKTLVTFIGRCLRNQVSIRSRSVAPHFHSAFYERACCWMTTEEWEGKDALLFYSLWGLAELVQHSSDINHTKSHLVETVQDVLHNVSASGPRWFAAYILSYFGVYGFPNKHDKGFGKALEDKEHTDVQLFFANGESVSAHGVILAVRCPSLLPLEQFPHHVKATDNFRVRDIPEKLCPKFRKEIRLSANVDQQALLKLLDYVYFGYLEAGEELARKLKTLAKCCNLQPLFLMLCRKIPKWGTPIPSSDLIHALGPVGFHFVDVILEAKATERRPWACSFCSLLVPHMHAHKVILQSSCNYLRALFQSGMQESHSQIIKVPISWEALIKLVQWFYSSELPNPPFGCLWDNMDIKERLYELKPYVELYWLAEFWILEDVRDACFRIVVCCLDSDRQLSIEVIKLAANFSLWKLVEVAAEYMAPLYHKLRDTGDLEELDELLVDLVRDASVRLSQDRGNLSG
ncbi:BTB/POZ domain-containing protein, putative isoform 1 [Theobroma cacao]|uniref:BTB/POZ domain-containing protein, putative isoform 1 n=2 Tax=Theobroma cacao TaxID=3641 RepID=A0A061F9U6_THECC|nr:BTB/POZ domain-containing protein, putative isoform 1 [Theobroma cacao]